MVGEGRELKNEGFNMPELREWGEIAREYRAMSYPYDTRIIWDLNKKESCDAVD